MRQGSRLIIGRGFPRAWSFSELCDRRSSPTKGSRREAREFRNLPVATRQRLRAENPGHYPEPSAAECDAARELLNSCQWMTSEGWVNWRDEFLTRNPDPSAADIRAEHRAQFNAEIARERPSLVPMLHEATGAELDTFARPCIYPPEGSEFPSRVEATPVVPMYETPGARAIGAGIVAAELRLSEGPNLTNGRVIIPAAINSEPPPGTTRPGLVDYIPGTQDPSTCVEAIPAVKIGGKRRMAKTENEAGPFFCDVEGCLRGFGSAKALNSHKGRTHKPGSAVE